MYQDICYDRYTEIKNNNKHTIIAERWLTYSDFGFHKWAGRKRGFGDINSFHSTTYPLKLTITDDQGNKVTINLLNTPDYEYAAGKITYVNWQSEKSRRRKKTLYILLPAGILLISGVFIYLAWLK